MHRTKEELEGKHWIDIISEEIIDGKKPPIVITGGMTTSGPPHLGTICESLYSDMIRKKLDEMKIDAKFYYMEDLLDAFDNIPRELEEFSDILKPELGKPLIFTLDPMKCHPSLGEHYFAKLEVIMRFLALKIELRKTNELYSEGKFDEYAILFLRNYTKTKEIVANTSMRKIESMANWSPIMPICENCGKVATTLITSHRDLSEKDIEYEYYCNADIGYVKGCGHKGKNNISEHKYKLQWRLHWPSWQAIFNTSVELSGVDHMTKGGSVTTCLEIHKELFHREPPLLYKYGFILFQGKKPSKSKGTGISAADAIKLMPPEILKYILVEPNLEQDKEFDPNGEKLIRIYDEVEALSLMKDPSSRADQKKLSAFRTAIKTIPWKAKFLDMLLNYQIYRDWNEVALRLKDKEGVEYLSKFIEEWISRGYAPEKYNFTIKSSKISGDITRVVKAFIEELNLGMNDLEIHNLVYKVARGNDIEPQALFTSIYNAIIGKDSGPRLGKLISALGIEKTKEMLSYAIS